MMKTLEDYLKTQDLGSESIQRICEDYVYNYKTIPEKKQEAAWAKRGIFTKLIEIDPITQIIINAFINNGYGMNTKNMEDDIDYAISMLNNVKISMGRKKIN